MTTLESVKMFYKYVQILLVNSVMPMYMFMLRCNNFVEIIIKNREVYK